MSGFIEGVRNNGNRSKVAAGIACLGILSQLSSGSANAITLPGRVGRTVATAPANLPKNVKGAGNKMAAHESAGALPRVTGIGQNMASVAMSKGGLHISCAQISRWQKRNKKLTAKQKKYKQNNCSANKVKVSGYNSYAWGNKPIDQGVSEFPNGYGYFTDEVDVRLVETNLFKFKNGKLSRILPAGAGSPYYDFPFQKAQSGYLSQPLLDEKNTDPKSDYDYQAVIEACNMESGEGRSIDVSLESDDGNDKQIIAAASEFISPGKCVDIVAADSIELPTPSTQRDAEMYGNDTEFRTAEPKSKEESISFRDVKIGDIVITVHSDAGARSIRRAVPLGVQIKSDSLGTEPGTNGFPKYERGW